MTHDTVCADTKSATYCCNGTHCAPYQTGHEIGYEIKSHHSILNTHYSTYKGELL